MNLKTAIQARLEERRAAEYLKRCKAATTAALAAIADEAEETGQDLQAVLNQYIGKTPTKGDAHRSQTEGERALALLKQSASVKSASVKSASVKSASNWTAKPTGTASPSPYATAPTDHVVALVRRGYVTGTDLAAARAELARRGVEILKHGFSHSCKNTQ